MQELKERVSDHESRIRSLEDTRNLTVKMLSDMDGKHETRIREVKQDLHSRMERMETDARDRDNQNASRLERLETKMDEIKTMFAKAIKQAPAWVWPLLSSVLAIAAWLIGKKG